MLRSLLLVVLFSVSTAFAQQVTPRDQMVIDSYLEAFGKAPSDGERKYWTGRTDWQNKTVLVDMHRQYLKSNEAAAKEAITFSYIHVFNRSATPTEISMHLATVRQGTTSAELQKTLRDLKSKQSQQANKPHKDNFEKNYSRDCAPCADAWVGEVYYKIWGVPASLTGGQNDACNIKLWNNGNWSSKDQLTSFIRNKYTGACDKGVAYVFIKPENVNFGLGTAGHIGWGFQLSDGSFYGGATENYAKGDFRTYWVNAGDDNDFWAEKFDTNDQMYKKMKSLGYTQYKMLLVDNPTVLKAKLRTEEIQMKGFQGISNNCLDHTYQVLEAYGIHWTKLPARQVFPFPNKWFNEFYKNSHGNGTYGHNM
ncbi:MAG TPA: hypothetical protein VGH19_06430 [Verrucomicrobiae bacterium]